MIERFIGGGIPKELAGMLGMLDTMIAHGGEERLGDGVKKVTGRPPRSFRSYVEKNREKFI